VSKLILQWILQLFSVYKAINNLAIVTVNFKLLRRHLKARRSTQLIHLRAVY